MIRVTVELVPHGDENYVKEIGQMVIANDGSGDSYLGNYEAWIGENDYTDEPAKFGRLEGHDRESGVWELIRLTLEAILHEKHIPDLEEESLSQLLRNRLTGSEE